MNKKIFGIIVCMLVITTFSVPLAGSIAIKTERIIKDPYLGTLDEQSYFAFSKKGSNMDNLAVTDSVSLVGAKAARINYVHRYNILTGSSDKGYVKISDNGGSSWSILWEFQGNIDEWQQNFFELNNWIGKTVKIGFQYVTGDKSISQGWSIDKIVIKVDDENKYEEDFEDYEVGEAWGEWIIKTDESPPENHPPYEPTINGPNRGGKNTPLAFAFQALDLDLDKVSYYIEWGDGDTSGWTQYFPIGAASYIEEHTYELEGTYTIKAKAKDERNAESGWTEHQIKITKPRSRQANNILFITHLENLLELLLKSFPLLNMIIDI